MSYSEYLIVNNAKTNHYKQFHYKYILPNIRLTIPFLNVTRITHK